MPLSPQPPFHRFGIRFTNNPDKDVEYVQIIHDENPEAIARGELFLNEELDEIYYVGVDSIARRLGDRATAPIDATRLDFSTTREFASDVEAASATPPVPIGGVYRTGNELKIRLV